MDRNNVYEFEVEVGLRGKVRVVAVDETQAKGKLDAHEWASIEPNLDAIEFVTDLAGPRRIG